MKHFTLLSLILMSFALVTAQAETKSSPSGKSKNAAETGIRDWLDRFTKAFSEKNLEAIMAFYADDVVAYDVVPPLQYVGKDAYRKDYEQFLALYEGQPACRSSRFAHWHKRRSGFCDRTGVDQRCA